MNIKDRMLALIIELQDTGIKDVQFPDISFDGDPDENYACIRNIDPDAYDTPYFDHDRCSQDFNAKVREHFSGDPSVTVKINSNYYVEAYRE